MYLHERTRIFVCRLAFVMLCALPTVCVVSAAVRFRSTSYIDARREEWIAVLADKLGVDVRIERLSYPLWNMALLENCELIDAETSAVILKARYVEISNEKTGWSVVAGHPEMTSEQLALAGRLFEQRLLQGRAVKLAPIRFESAQFTITHPDRPQTFENVAAEITTTENGRRAQLHFQVVGQAATEKIEFVVQRERHELSPQTICKLDTHGSSIPCAAMSQLAPWLANFGPDATFTGIASLQTSSQSHTAELSGKFDSVMLTSLLATRFPQHHLTGVAELDLANVRFHNGVFVEAKGTLRTKGGGTINRTLLDAIAQRLQLAPVGPVADRQQKVRYSQLAFGFDLGTRGLAITGVPDPPYDGDIMTSGSGVLLEESNVVVPAIALVHALCAENDVDLANSIAAKELLGALPSPIHVAREPREYRAPIRLKKIR